MKKSVRPAVPMDTSSPLDQLKPKAKDAQSDLARLRSNDPTLMQVDWSGIGVKDELVLALAEAIGAEPQYTQQDIDEWFEAFEIMC